MTSSSRGGPRISRERSQQPAIPGMGLHFRSPRQPRNKRKTQEIVDVPGQRLKRAHLLAELQALKADSVAIDLNPTSDPTRDSFDVTGDDIGQTSIIPPASPSPTCPKPFVRKRCPLPGTQADRLTKKWKSILPSVAKSLLSYQCSALGRPVSPPNNLLYACQNPICNAKMTTILCLYLDRMFCSLSMICSSALSDYIFNRILQSSCLSLLMFQSLEYSG